MVRAVSLNFNKKLSNGTSAAYIKGLSNLEFSENRCIQTSEDQVGINLALYWEMVMPEYGNELVSPLAKGKLTFRG